MEKSEEIKDKAWKISMMADELAQACNELKAMERYKALPINEMLVQFNNVNQKEIQKMSSEVRHLEDTVESQYSQITILKSMLKEAGCCDIDSSLKSRMDALKESQEAEWEESRW